MSNTENPFPLETEYIGADMGSSGSGFDTGTSSGTDLGASGDSTGAVDLSTGGLVAIVIVVVLVTIGGATMAALFFIAKKREWRFRDTLRYSAKKVVTALTPRRSEFPKELKDPSRPKPRARLNDVPPTPRLRPEDVEKGLARAAEKKKKGLLWGRS